MVNGKQCGKNKGKIGLAGYKIRDNEPIANKNKQHMAKGWKANGLLVLTLVDCIETGRCHPQKRN